MQLQNYDIFVKIITVTISDEDKHLIQFWQKNKALRSAAYNRTLSRKEMDIKLNMAVYKTWGIMQDRVYARKITSVDGTQAEHLWRMGQDWSAADWQCHKIVA